MTEQPLVVNSRAALLAGASSPDSDGREPRHFPPPPPPSNGRRPGQNNENHHGRFRNVNLPPVTSKSALGTDRFANRQVVEASSSAAGAFQNDRKRYGKAVKLRNQWDQADRIAKTDFETCMERLLAALEDVPVGSLFGAILEGQAASDLVLSIESLAASDGTIRLGDAGILMMDGWRTRKDWTQDETHLAGRILLRMEKEELLGGGKPVEYQHYLGVMNAFAKIADHDETAAIRAENILDHMEKRADEGRVDLKNDRLSINTFLGAHAKTPLTVIEAHGQTLNNRNFVAIERMLGMMESSFASGDCTMQPTVRTYSKIIDTYAKAGRAEGAARVLARMEDQYRHGNKKARPGVIHYTNVIDACAKIGAAEEATKTLQSMLDLYEKGDSALEPDVVLFSAALNAWKKAGRPTAPEQSLKILELMAKFKVAPDIMTYNIILHTLADTGDSVYLEEAENLLYFIERSSSQRADSFTYNAVIKGSPPEAAEKLIRHWELQYKKGETDERPDSYSYTSLIKAWVKSNVFGFEEKCLDILEWMEEQRVVGMNRIVYNEVIRALGRSTRGDAGEMAELVFQRLVARYEAYRDRDTKPDKFTYMSLLSAYARSSDSNPGNALKAEGILRDMLDKRDIPNPDKQLFNEVIAAWARSSRPEAVSHAEALMDLMESLHIGLDTVVFNSLMNVYAKNADSDRASRHAMVILRRMHDSSIRPNSVTYTLMVEACHKDEDKMVELFEDCTRKGMLDKKVESAFLEHGPGSIQNRLRGGSIPREWSQFANRGPEGKSRNQIRRGMKHGPTGEDIGRFGWAR